MALLGSVQEALPPQVALRACIASIRIKAPPVSSRTWRWHTKRYNSFDRKELV